MPLATALKAAIRQPKSPAALATGMAIYHLAVKVIGRSSGQSAIAAAAYRSGEKLIDEATGEVKHYPARAERIKFTGIFAPPGAPSWVYDRNRLWNEAERAENRKDATLAREIVVALPHELTDEQRRWLVSDFVREAFVRRGLVADVAIHAPDRSSNSRNFHAHILITERTIKGGGKAAEEIRAPETGACFLLPCKGHPPPLTPVSHRRKIAASTARRRFRAGASSGRNLCNRHLARHGHAARIDHRTLAAQGVDREPTRHLGHVAAQMMKRGASSIRGDELRAIRARNALRAVNGAMHEIAGSRQSVRVAAGAMEWASTRGRVVLPSSPATMFSGLPTREEATFERAGQEIGQTARARPPLELHEPEIGDESPSEPCSYEAEVRAITGHFAMAIEVARQSNRSRFEIEGMIRALREEQRAALHAVRERRRVLRSSLRRVHRLCGDVRPLLQCVT